MKKEKILIIDKHQFGYLTDSYKWSEYLRSKYKVSVICFDTGQKKMNLDDVDINYVKYYRNYTVRGSVFILYSIFKLLFFRGKAIIVYFENCEVIKRICKKNKVLLDIRTLSVSESEERRLKFDDKLRKACLSFDNISVISEGVKRKLNIEKSNISILPLGADRISDKKKNYDNLKLLYVGTLSGRHIDVTLNGLSLFLSKCPESNITYDIVGDGQGNELEELKLLCKSMGIDEHVYFHGRIPHNELKSFFDKCNIGVAFIPVTDYFNFQPPTKTFEYILSGLFTIATNTFSNKEIINNDNGYLIDDSAECFCMAIEYINGNYSSLNYYKIFDSLSQYTWERIVYDSLIPVVDKL